MEEIILEMVEQAKREENYDLIDYVRRLVVELVDVVRENG